MPELLHQTMHSFITERFTLSKILDMVQDKSVSHLIEINGKSGSGKSYLIQPIVKAMTGRYAKLTFFSPHPLSFNHFSEILSIISALSQDELKEYYEEHNQRYRSGRKYDFFYFITEKLRNTGKLETQLLIIDDCDVLDSYTRDFLQYLVQYAEDAGIQIIAISQKRLFPFSTVEYIPVLATDDLQKLISKSFPNQEIGYVTESEILHKITDGNLMIIEKILSEMLSLPQPHFDLSPYLDRTFVADEIYNQSLEAASQTQLELLICLYALDGIVTSTLLEQILDVPNLKGELAKLSESGLISCQKKSCLIQKKSAFGNWLAENKLLAGSTLADRLLETLTKTGLMPQVQVRLLMINGKYKEDLFNRVIEDCYKITDNESLLELYKYILEHTKKPAKLLYYTQMIGLAYADLNQKDKAVDYFRQSLHLCSQHNLPAEEVVYHLAANLYAVNSSNFALEIIRKYSPATIDNYWKSKILLLKADVLAETESFDEALQVLEEVIRGMSLIEEREKRYIVQADCKKTKGKIHYYVNEWDAAEEAFKDAESLYNVVKDHNGLAAIYNNLGVLYMFQGDWERSEQFFLRSLTLEKEYFSLNGISVCYNNLGGLMDDKGDQDRSLFYLEEALKIQKLLSEPYNITNIYNNIGVTWMDHSHFDRAEEALKKSLETAMNFGFYRNIVASLNNLGALFFKKGDWAKSISYYEQGISKSEENNFTEGLLRSFNNLGEVYEKQGELNLAYDLYFKGLELLPRVSDEYIKAELYGNLGSVLTRLHKFKEAYSYLVESFDFFKSLNARDKIIEGCQKQAYYFILTRNYESADYYISQAAKFALELNHAFEQGRAFYLRALLERKNLEQAKQNLDEAIRLFIETSNNYELSLANYELAGVLYDMKEWEQALQILKTNKKIIQQYGSIKILEQNDILMQKISREYSEQMKDMKFEENLLNQFYEITQKLNTISDLDVLIDNALSSLIEISEADGGILCLHHNATIPESWDYKIYQNFSHDDPAYDTFMNLIMQVHRLIKLENYKQPHFAPSYNNILLIPLSIRKSSMGVVLLYSKSGSHYFSERIINLINALANQIIVIIDNIRSLNLEKSHAIIREQLNAGNIYANIIGKSPEMIKIFDVIEKIKDTPTSVLLEGPSGTGKELIARALHYSSNRRNKAFVAQYCGALPETLLESELFGHVKGSFTGAAYDKKGLFEIADISQSTQAKLLRFLQEGEIKRVGATKTEKVNVRVVCATNVSLLERVQSGDFRLDLYYRLNVIKIEVPPLKNRPGDIPLLAIYFLDKYNKRINKSVSGISKEAMHILEHYDWPGNVRQLENEIERAVTLAEENSFIKPSDFSEEVCRYIENTQAVNLLKTRMSLKDATEELERKMILEAMNEFDWNQTQASKELGLSRQGLIKKLKRYNLYRGDE